MEAARHDDDTLRAGELEVRLSDGLVLAAGRPLAVSLRELRLLVAMLERRDRIVPREELYRLAWGRPLRNGDRSVDVYVHKLRTKLETALPKDAWLLMSAARLRQALLNLIGNAIKYTPAGGRVRVALTVSDAGDTATIAVSDTGPGIPAADLPHIFEKFYRVKSRATEGTPGTGLGLAIVKSIVDLHRGRVRGESVEGAGSTFVVDLPLGDG